MGFARVMQLLSWVGVVLIFIFKPKRKVILFPKYLIFYLLFILYVFFSTFYLLEREFKFKYLFSLSLIGGFNMMLIIENIPIDKNQFKFIVRWSKVILFVAFFVILTQQVVDRTIFLNETNYEDVAKGASGTKDKLHSIFSWLNPLASGFGFVPIFLVVFELIYRNKRGVIFWVSMGLIYALLTKSRWTMLNMLLVFVFFFLNNKNNLFQLMKTVIVSTVISIIIFSFSEYVGLDVKGIVNDKIFESDKKSFSQKSASTRLLAFTAFNKFYWDNPILGKGNIKYGMGGTHEQDYKLKRFLKGRSSQIHVGYLSLFYMYGLIGGFLFLSFLFLLIIRLFKNAKETSMWGPFLGFLGFAIANLTLVSFTVFQMGFILVLTIDKYYISNKKLNV